jgi:myo-inositol 2-dehydrogenase / D-chiro-inositol 1-dehydrogenase
MKSKLQLGLIGAGRIGRLHAEHVQTRIPNANLVAVADVHLPAAQQLADHLGIDGVSANYERVLADPRVDAVLICSATNTHAQIIEEAAAAGKHIFCEKPIAHSLAEIDRALAAVDKAGVKFQIGFNRRFDANYRRVRQAIESGEIGQPHLLHIISRDPAPPPIDYIKVSGGIFLDMTIHDFDMARYLIGSEVEEIYATGGVMVDPAIGEAGDLDTVMVMLKFENDVIGTIDNSRRAVYGYDQRVEVFGSGGAISTGNNYPNTAIVSGSSEIRRDLPLNFFLDRYVESYVRELTDFVQAVQNDQPTPLGPRDGRVPVVMALAARRSYEENRPVSLQEIG